jgi:uncharacterized membrane protein
MYPVLKALHVLGVVFYLGNLLVTAVWQTLADRSGDVRVAQHAQRLARSTDLVFTGGGALILLATGLHLAATLIPHFWEVRWIMEGLGFFVISVLIWAAVLMPIQARQGRLLAAAAPAGPPSADYLRLGRIRLWAGVAAVLPAVWAIWVMVVKRV